MKSLSKQLHKVNIFKSPLSTYTFIKLDRMFIFQKILASTFFLQFIKVATDEDVNPTVLLAIYIRIITSILLVNFIAVNFRKKTVMSTFGLVRGSYFMIPIFIMEILLVLLNILPDTVVLPFIISIFHLGEV